MFPRDKEAIKEIIRMTKASGKTPVYMFLFIQVKFLNVETFVHELYFLNYPAEKAFRLQKISSRRHFMYIELPCAVLHEKICTE